MTEKVSKILRGFLGLTSTERDEFIKELERYQKSSYYDKLEFERYVRQKSSLGPKNTICDCCGR